MQMKTQLEGRKGSKVTMENAKDSKRQKYEMQMNEIEMKTSKGLERK